MIVMFRRLLPRIVEFLGGGPAVTVPVITVRLPDRDAAFGQATAEALAPIPHAVIASSADPAEPVASVVDGFPLSPVIVSAGPDVPVHAQPHRKTTRRKGGRGTLAVRAMVPRTDLATAIQVLRVANSVSVAEIAAETGLHQTTIYHVTRGAFASSHNYRLVTEGIRAIAARRPAPREVDSGKTFRIHRITNGVSVRHVAADAQINPVTVSRAQRGLVRTPGTYEKLSGAVTRVHARQVEAVRAVTVVAPAVMVEMPGAPGTPGAVARGLPRIMQSVIDFDSGLPPSHPRQMKAGIVRQMRLARNLSVGDVARGLRMRQQLVEMLESGECHNVDSYDAIVRRIQTVWPYGAGDPGNGMSR